MMERETARRRLSTISRHLGILTEDATAHLRPLSCSSYFRTRFTRLDGRLHFARQASVCQGNFMRQTETSMEQGNKPRVCTAKDSHINANKSTAAMTPLFSRRGMTDPLFARPAQAQGEFNCYDASIVKPLKQEKVPPSTECPHFTKPDREMSKMKQSNSTRKNIISSQINGIEWLPRINVAESKRDHIISVELPGVDINHIRVEMDNKNIIVRGRRSLMLWKAGGCSNHSVATFHKKEILHGPYLLVWPIPAGVNKDSVSAEFVEGILQITLRKPRITRIG